MNQKLTEKGVTSIMVSALSSTIAKDAFAKYQVDTQDAKHDDLTNSTISITDFDTNLNPTITINAKIGTGDNCEEREYLIDKDGIFSNPRSVPYALDSHMHSFSSETSKNYDKFWNNLTSSKLANIMETVTNQANNKLNAKILTNQQSNMQKKHGKKKHGIMRMFKRPKNAEIKHNKNADIEPITLDFDGLDDQHKQL